MKKIIGIMLVAIFGLFLMGCQTDDTIYSVIVPAGGPALSQMYLQDNSDRYAVDVVNGPDPLIAAFGAGTHDFIFAPTNVGAKLYTANPSYIFIAAISFGSYFLVTDSSEDFTIASLEGKDIVVFGQNQTSDIIIQYVLQENNITATFTYVDSVATALSLWVADHSKIIMTAEPSLSVLLASNPTLDVIDLQDEYEAITGSDSYPQAGVFAKATLTNKQIDSFLEDLEASIAQVNAEVEESAALAVELGYGFAQNVLLTAIPNSHLDFVSALDVKLSLEAYFTIILDVNPVLIGGALPVDGFYYQP